MVLSAELCALVRPVPGRWSAREIIAGHPEEEGAGAVLTLTPDTWHCHIVTGAASLLWRAVPYELPYVTYQRRGGPLQCYPTSKLYRHHRLMGFLKPPKAPGRPEPAKQAVDSEPAEVRQLVAAQRRRRYDAEKTMLQGGGYGTRAGGAPRKLVLG